MKIDEAEQHIAKILASVEKTNNVVVESVEIRMLDVTCVQDMSPTFRRQVILNLVRQGDWA